ncbi:MAG TPA: DUF2796 domain-containing protein [Spongiibacteraceae bacterium]
MAALLLLVSGIGQAHEHREHGAHVHGVATLTLAIAERGIDIEFESPAVNLIGFEHAPHSANDQRAIDRAAQVLAHPLAFLSLPPAAHCVVIKSAVESELLKSTAQKTTTDTPHSESFPAATHDDSHHHEHDSDEPEGHANFNAKYHLECKQPQALNTIDIKLFDTFNGIEKINAQWLTDGAQSARVLTPTDRSINLR